MDTKNYGPDVLRGLIEETPTTRDLLQQLMYELDDFYRFGYSRDQCLDMISDIRDHLKKPEPVPVAWVHDGKDEPYDALQWFEDSYSNTPLFTKEQL